MGRVIIWASRLSRFRKNVCLLSLYFSFSVSLSLSICIIIGRVIRNHHGKDAYVDIET